MGVLLSQHNRNDEAILHFQESVRLNPTGIEGIRNLGNSYQMAGRYAEAIEAYRLAVRLHPDDVEGHVRLGYAYLITGNIDLAYQEQVQLKRLNEAYARALLDSIQASGKR
nr:tetratricopeptide repeat protein [Geomobilimonas luticola]